MPAPEASPILLRGRVVLAGSDAPPRNAVVTAWTGDPSRDVIGDVSLVAAARAAGLGESGEHLAHVPAFRVEARADGRFEIALPDDVASVELEAEADGCCCQPAEPILLDRVSLATEHLLELSPAVEIEGRVLAESGEPLGGAIVRAEPATLMRGRRFDRRRVLALTDAQGRFRIRGLAPGPHSIAAVTAGRGPAVVVVEAWRTDAPVRTAIDLPRGRSIAGTLVDAAGRPIQRALVRLHLVAEGLFAFAGRSSRSDASGSFVLRDLAPGAHRVLVTLDGAELPNELESFVVDDTDDGLSVRWTLPETYSIEGRVVDTQGQGVPTAAVSTHGTRGRTDRTERSSWSDANHQVAWTRPDGTFRLQGLGPGPFQVHALRAGFGRAERTDVSAGTRDLEIVLRERPALRGQVIDAETSEPVPVFTVETMHAQSLRVRGVEFPSMRDRAVAFRAADGRFELCDRSPEVYRVVVVAPGYAPSTLQDVDLRSAGANLVVRMGRGATIRGRIVDGASGAPLAAVRLDVEDLARNVLRIREPPARASSRPDGSFEIHDVEPLDRAVVVARHDARVPTSSPVVRLVAGSTVEVGDLPMERGGSCAGRVVDAAGRPHSGWELHFLAREPMHPVADGLRAKTTDAEGRFRVEGLSAGVWTVNAYEPLRSARPIAGRQRRSVAGTVVIRSGETTTVDFANRPEGRRLRGRVRIGERAVAGVWVRVEAVNDRSVPRSFSLLGGARTDAEGRFGLADAMLGPIHLAIGNTSVGHSDSPGASSTSYRFATTVLDEPELDLDVAIPPGGEIRGRVVRAGDGGPLERVIVFACAAEGGDGSAFTSSGAAVSDAQGEFRISDLLPGTYEVGTGVQPDDEWSRGPFLVPAERSRVVLHAGATTTVELSLVEGAEVVADVVDRDGRPRPDAWDYAVVAGGPQPPKAREPMARAVPSGTARLRGVVPGELFVLADVEGRPLARSERLSLVAGESARIELRFSRGTRVRVQGVVDQGEAVVVTSLVFLDAAGNTLSRARAASALARAAPWLEAEVPPGRVRLLVDAEGCSHWEGEVEVGDVDLQEIKLSLMRS